MNETLALKIRQLPDSPGCYQMKENGKIIYVGKAVNLKNRVRSYFCTREHTPKVAAMISHITDFDIILCRSNLEALILECNLIKLYRPYYNILLKDDKHYPYIRIDLNDPFPRVETVRKLEKDGAKYYGPYIGTGAVNDVTETLRGAFPLRSCKGEIRPDRKRRPCVNYEIGRCLAPCAGKCTEEEYAAVISGVCRFLSGKYAETVAALKEEMIKKSAAMQFEQAAVLRDRIRDIEGLMQRQQAIQTRDTQQDVIALARDGLDAMVNILCVRGGKMIGSESIVLAGEGMEDPDEVLFDFLLQYYDSEKPAAEVICAAMPEEMRADMEEWLREKRGAACTLTVPQRGEKRALALMSEKNAKDALEKRNARRSVQEERTAGACRELQRLLSLDSFPSRIEGFDISNTQGEESVASMSVFTDGVPDKKEYRHFRIRTVDGPNDFASLYETLSRRFARCSSEKEEERWPVPDLVLIDGGKEQLAYAQKAMHEAGLHISMFALSEEDEAVWLPGKEDPLIIDRHSGALYLIQRVRDEAHRFAITYHRALRTKKQTHSSLEDIPGIGPVKRRALLSHFHSLRALREAGVEEIRSVQGMSPALSEKLYNALHAGEAAADTVEARGESD